MAEQIVNRTDLSSILDGLYGSQPPLFRARALVTALRGYAEQEVGLEKPTGVVLINMADVITEQLNAALRLQEGVELALMAANRAGELTA